MNNRQASRRYMGLLVPLTLLFLACCLGLSWLDRNTDTSNVILAVLALLPIAALLSMFWVQWRYMRDLDEYLRQVHVKALLFGAAVALGVGTGWGFLELFVDAPALPVYWLNPLFWVAYSTGVVALSLRDAKSPQ
jgi:hypothetical protein